MRVPLAVKLTFATALCAVLVAIAIPIVDPAAHSVDLRPGIPLFLGFLLVLAIWVATFARWIIRQIRRSPEPGSQGEAGS